MKKRIRLIVFCVCLCLLFPISVKAISDTSKIVPDAYTPDGKAVFHIDVSREEWEIEFFKHPYFKNRKANEPINAVFLLPDTATREMCPYCHTNNLVYQEEWKEKEIASRTCPAMGAYSDIRVGWTWFGQYRCNSCDYEGDEVYSDDRNDWSWYMYCYEDNYDLDAGYRINIGRTIHSGGDVHTCYSIRMHDNAIVHGLNCCPTVIYYREPAVSHGPGCCCYGSHHAFNNIEGLDD